MAGAGKKLRRLIDDGGICVGIMGLGYVGLPIAVRFCEEGMRVLGFDVDPSKVKSLNRGTSYIKHIPDEKIASFRKGPGPLFEATVDMERIGEADAIIICVPTPLSDKREPDLTYVTGTVEEISGRLRPGHLVVLESTTYPGTTEEVVLPMLERGGLRAGKDFFLAFSPEREDPGRKDFTTRTTPKIIGGVTPGCRDLAVRLYSRIVERVVPVSSTRVAEMTKLLENIYRSVNIALVNELKVLCQRMGLDIWEVIEAASTKPFGFQAFYPGPGLGGHCIPIDPFYLTWKAREYDMATRFIELAGEINTSMPYYVVDRVARALNEERKSVKGSRILVLGISYKKDIDDTRESPAIEIIKLLKAMGASVTYNDPHVKRAVSRRKNFDMKSVPLTERRLAASDCVVIATDHSAYDYRWIVKNSSIVVDTRNATSGIRSKKIVKA